ncbi:MAG: 50S ribosome-binding GTPase, partial [Phycisphaerae bacterium]|nr:50S ribosome-binding GTPase [Phycisphaerae bacterium]
VGEPNAGKSTLFNALLGARRAVESEDRGTTRDVLCEELDLGSHVPGAGRVMLCDSAGIDERIATGPSESAAQSATCAAIADADVIVWCDPSGEFGRGAAQGAGHRASGIKEHAPSPALGERGGAIDVRSNTPIIRVRTKSDRAAGRLVLSSSSPTAGEDVSEGTGHQSSGIGESTPSLALGARRDEPTMSSPTVRESATSSRPPDALPSPVIPVCALDAWNLGVLRRAIADAAGVGGSEGLAVARHAAALRAARAAISRLPGDIDPAARALAHPETIAESLREAIDHLGAIGGRLTTEDILGKVFSAFCVGK